MELSGVIFGERKRCKYSYKVLSNVRSKAVIVITLRKRALARVFGSILVQTDEKLLSEHSDKISEFYDPPILSNSSLKFEKT